MTTGPVKSWADRLLGFSLAVVASAWLLHWAWQLLRPMFPVLVLGLIAVGIGRLVLARRRTW